MEDQNLLHTVSALLSDLLDSACDRAKATTAEDTVTAISPGHQVDDEIQLLIQGLIEKVSTNLEDTQPSYQSTMLKNLKAVGHPTDPKSLAALGISQTGRVMDPICLQQVIFSSIAAENLVEYQWPPDASGDYYMLQEQVSTFLNITSFKRKYPSIERRKLDPAEVNHLLTNHVISEVQVTLGQYRVVYVKSKNRMVVPGRFSDGLTALRSADVCDLLMKEYPDKYEEYSKVMQEREKQKMRNKYKQYASSANPPMEKSQMSNYMKRAIKQAAAYNAHLNRQRREDFSVYYDMSTNVLQYPKHKKRKVDPSLTTPSLYPCALIPGQFQEYYHRYTKNELMYLPLNTALYGPPNPPPNTTGNMSESDSDSAADSDGSVSSLPRSVRSSASNKIKSKPDASDLIADESNSRSVADSEPVEENQKTVKNKDPEKPECGICLKDETSNKKNEPEELIKCSQCDNHGHPSCLEMSQDLVSVILTYNWQCMECKTCTICSLPHREDLMMFCDRCDRGYHTFCVSLRAIPSGVWACSRCNYADPDFVKRKRKKMRASISPGRGRGRRRRQPKRSDTASQLQPPLTPSTASNDSEKFNEKLAEQEPVATKQVENSVELKLTQDSPAVLDKPKDPTSNDMETDQRSIVEEELVANIKPSINNEH